MIDLISESFAKCIDLSFIQFNSYRLSDLSSNKCPTYHVFNLYDCLSLIYSLLLFSRSRILIQFHFLFIPMCPFFRTYHLFLPFHKSWHDITFKCLFTDIYHLCNRWSFKSRNPRHEQWWSYRLKKIQKK